LDVDDLGVTGGVGKSAIEKMEPTVVVGGGGVELSQLPPGGGPLVVEA